MAEKFINVKVSLDPKAYDLHGDFITFIATAIAFFGGLIGFSLIFQNMLAFVFAGMLTWAVFKVLKNHYQKVREEVYATNRTAMKEAVAHTGFHLVYDGAFDNPSKAYLIDPETDDYYTSIAGVVEDTTFSMVFSKRS